MTTYPHLTADDVSTLTTFFQGVDTDGNGFITADEIKQACEVDTNSDGTISVTEAAASSLPWLTDFVEQDSNNDSNISLDELLAYNDKIKS